MGCLSEENLVVLTAQLTQNLSSYNSANYFLNKCISIFFNLSICSNMNKENNMK